jgi:hypothetical protein
MSIDSSNYAATERRAMLAMMQATSDAFYAKAVHTGVHSFVEFAGLMNEFIKVCTVADNSGQDFVHSNTHCGSPLPFEHYHLGYLAEKLNCIYGPGLFAKKELRDAFIHRLFEGEYRLVPAEMLEDA